MSVDIVFRTIDEGASQGAEKITKGLGGVNNSFKSMIMPAITAGAAIAGVTKFLKDSVSAAAESERVMAKLEATLRATGRGAELSSAGIERIAGKLMALSSFDDEAIVNAYNSLMKFENIPTDKMDEVVKISMDMSAALGRDLASSAELVGRILETGTIPRTLGFSAALRDQIIGLIEAGEKGKAFTLVMDEMNKRYGGQAAAQIETYTGKVERLKNTWENFMEQVGEAPMESGKPLIDSLSAIIEKSGEMISVYMRAREMAGADNFWYLLYPPKGGMDVINIIRNLENAQNEILETEKWTEYGLAWEQALLKAGVITEDSTEAIRDYAGELSFITGFAASYTSGLKSVETAVDNLHTAQTKLAELQKAGWSDSSKAVKDAKAEVDRLADELGTARTESKRATDEMIAGFLQTQLTMDGTFTEDDMLKVLEYRKAVGLLTDEEYEAALQAMDIVTALTSIPATVTSQVSVFHHTFYSSSGDGSQPFGPEPGESAPLPPGEAGWGDETEYDGATAQGGSVRGHRRILVGDKPGGVLTPWSEIVDLDRGYVYNASQTRKILGFASGGNVPYSEPGDIFMPGTVPDANGNPTMPVYNLPINPNGLPSGGGGGGGGGYTPPIASPVQSPIQDIMNSISETANTTQAVTAAAQQISRSGEETAKATREDTYKQLAGSKEIADKLDEMIILLHSNFNAMPRMMLQAAAKGGL